MFNFINKLHNKKKQVVFCFYGNDEAPKFESRNQEYKFI